MDTQDRLRRLPKVDEALKDPLIAEEVSAVPRRIVVDALREAIEQTRARVLADGSYEFTSEDVLREAKARIALKSRRSLRRVVNATGIIVHTNLGRSLLSQKAAQAVFEVATGYSTLEYDLESGERGSRHVHCEDLICRLTGAEAAMAVNNNAAAVMLGIAGLARGGEAIVSRGQLIEIGGSFRIPDIMAESGATMVEVGTTNKTHLSDYANAITDRTRLILKVHSSNFRVVGFTEEVGLADLIALGAEYGIPVFEDQGSGVLLDLREYGLSYEPTIGESIAAGADLVSCSGDKLLGGPQAGILAGKASVIEALKKHPMARALRLDKMTLAALEVTLRSYLDPVRVREEIPTLRMLTIPKEEIGKRAHALASRIEDACADAYHIEVLESVARAGGGALPMADIPTVVVSLKPLKGSEDDLQTYLRSCDPPIITRVREGAVLIDPRTLQEGEDALLVEALAKAVRSDRTG